MLFFFLTSSIKEANGLFIMLNYSISYHYFSPRINGILQSKLLVGGNYIGSVSTILNSFNNASTTRCCTVFYVDLIRINQILYFRLPWYHV